MVGLPISVSMAFISLLHPYALGPYEHIRNISVGPRIRSVFNSQLGLPTLKSSSVARASLLQAAKGDKEPLADAGLKPPGRSSSSTRVEKRYPFEGYQKPLERRWDGFWREAVSVPPGCSRRHIVMVNVFKQSILSMRAWAIEQDAVDALREVYRTLINEHYTIQLGTHCTLTYLEAALFFALHNLRFNIFIGSSIWNQLNNNVGARVDAVSLLMIWWLN